MSPDNSQKEIERKDKAATKKERSKERTVWFCLGFRNFWDKPTSRKIHSFIQEYKLTWLCVSVSYHKYTNLHQMFQSDMNRKCSLRIIDEDLPTWPCNCNVTSKMANGKYLYNGYCRVPYVVYKIKDIELKRDLSAKSKGTSKIEHKNILEMYVRYSSQDITIALMAIGVEQEDTPKRMRLLNMMWTGVENATIAVRSRRGWKK